MRIKITQDGYLCVSREIVIECDHPTQMTDEQVNELMGRTRFRILGTDVADVPANEVVTGEEYGLDWDWEEADEADEEEADVTEMLQETIAEVAKVEWHKEGF